MFCSKERCPFCGAQLVTCGCISDVLGLSPDLPPALQRWRDKEGLTYDLLSDPEHELLEALGAWGEKSMYGKKYMGIERATFLIDETGVVRGEWRKVKVPGHVEAVLEAAQAL